MNHLKILSAALVLCLAPGRAQAYDFMTGGVAYNILSNTNTRKTVAVTYTTTQPDASGYITTYRGNVVIPAQVSWNMQTFNVTQVGDLAMFNNQSLYTLRLPEGVSAIGRQALSHCYSLTEVNIPSTVSRIADYAFEFCEDLTSVSLPARLADMGEGVFQQCFGLKTIEVDPECEEFTSIDGILYANTAAGMTLLVYPGARDESAYVMPDNVTRIDSYALSANRTLRDMTLSKTLTTIDFLAFSECEALESITVPEGNTHFSSSDGVLFDADTTTLVYYPLKRPADAYTIPEGVTAIDPLAFSQFATLREITLPSTLTQIGELAFYRSTTLTKVTSAATVPPAWSASTLVPSAGLFDNTVYSQAELYVPAQAVDAYRKATGWKNFKTILPIGASGAIDAISTDPATVPENAEYFDLYGRSIPRPAGLHILRLPSSTSLRYSGNSK